jgi:hypothetical protein
LSIEHVLVPNIVTDSIRLMFSIGDVSGSQEEFDQMENEEADESESEDEAVNTYPIRCSFSITKVAPVPSSAEPPLMLAHRPRAKAR